MHSGSIRGGWIDPNIDSIGSADIGIGSILRGGNENIYLKRAL